jgi:phosphoadenosine phosphosulfate reductase
VEGTALGGQRTEQGSSGVGTWRPAADRSEDVASRSDDVAGRFDPVANGSDPVASSRSRDLAGWPTDGVADPAPVGGVSDGWPIDRAEVAGAARRLETASAGAVLRWALARFGRTNVVVASSFQDAVLVDVAVSVDPAVRVVFLDTGYHFAETLAYVETLRARYDLDLQVVRPGLEAAGVPCGAEGCCQVRKVAPLARALAGRRAWVSGVRRADAATRRSAAAVEWDATRGLVKVNPLVTWTDDDVLHYQRDHDLPVHPLVPRGYLSIGCAPTTVPVAPGADPRSGRWAGSDRTECGLHV